MSTSPVSAFDHITIVAAQLAQAVADYTALFGHAPIWQGQHPELGTESALWGLDNAMVELTAPRAGAEEAEGLREWLAAGNGGLQAIAFATDDAAASSRLLRERGVRATPPQAGQALDAQGNARPYTTVDLSPRMTRGLPVLVVERADRSGLIGTTARPTEQFHALDHVAIRTSNIDAAKRLYGDGLGARLALERDFNGTRMLFFRVGGVTLEVIEDTALGESDAFYGAAYRVRDLAAAHRRMLALDFELSDMRAGNKPGTTVFTARSRTQGVPTLVLHDPSRA